MGFSRQKIRDLLPVLQAYADNKEIERFTDGIWKNSNKPLDEQNYSFEYDANLYRVKPNPVYVPFDYEDRHLFKNEWFRLKENHETYIAFNDDGSSVNHLFKIIHINNAGVGLFINDTENFITYSKLFSTFELENGQPAGKIVEMESND